MKYLTGIAALEFAYSVLAETLRGHEHELDHHYTDADRLAEAMQALQNVAAEEWSTELKEVE